MSTACTHLLGIVAYITSLATHTWPLIDVINEARAAFDNAI